MTRKEHGIDRLQQHKKPENPECSSYLMLEVLKMDTHMIKETTMMIMIRIHNMKKIMKKNMKQNMK